MFVDACTATSFVMRLFIVAGVTFASFSVVIADTPVNESDSISVEESLVWQTLEPPYTEATPLPIQGRAMYYNPGIMQQVRDYRLSIDRVDLCEVCIGYVAMLRYGDLNRRVWIQLEDSTIEGPFQVIDTAATKHVGLLLEREWIIDVDYATAHRWGMTRPWLVTVWASPLDIYAYAKEHIRVHSTNQIAYYYYLSPLQKQPLIPNTNSWHDDKIRPHDSATGSSIVQLLLKSLDRALAVP